MSATTRIPRTGRSRPGPPPLRWLADETGTSTRAVYTLFGSKAGLIDALGSRAFDWLVTEHPGLFRVAFGGRKADAHARTRDAAGRALHALHARFTRLERAGMLSHRTPGEAAREFHALCLGLAELELREPLSTGRSRRMWRATP